MKKITQKIMAGSLAIYLVLGLVVPINVMAAGPAAVNLLTAGNFSLISKAGITNTGSHASVITGNIGSSPITAAALNNVFCTEMTGTIYGVDAAYVGSGNQACFAGNPPLSNKTLIDNAVLDMGTAYTDAAGRPALAPDTNLYAGNLGGQTFAPGLYKWTTDVTIPTDVTFSGSATDVWIMQIDGNLNIASGGSVPAGIKVILTGGAQASNIFWQVGGGTGATLGTYSTFNGNILSATQVVMQTGAVFNGRALAQTLITLDANKIGGLGAVTLPIVPVVTPPSSGSGITPITPVINITKTATPSALPTGPGSVTYNYTVTNPGQRALTDIKVVDNRCSSVGYISGDENVNNKIEPSEIWKYSCTITLQNTTTNTVVATGISDDPYRQTANTSASITVIVADAKITPPVTTPPAITPPVTTPAPTLPVIEPTTTTKIPVTTTIHPKTSTSTITVPGLPNTGLQTQSTSPLNTGLIFGFAGFSGLIFMARKKFAVAKI